MKMKVNNKIQDLKYAIYVLKQGLPLANFEIRNIFTQKDLIALKIETLGAHIRMTNNGEQLWSNQFLIPSDDKNQLAIQILKNKLEQLESKVLESFMY